MGCVCGIGERWMPCEVCVWRVKKADGKCCEQRERLMRQTWSRSMTAEIQMSQRSMWPSNKTTRATEREREEQGVIQERNKVKEKQRGEMVTF